MKRIHYVLAGMMLIFAVSCVSPEEWNDKYENIVPEPVSDVKVENINGGAVITYSLPYVKDLKGAKIVYSLTDNGEVMERWASVESDTIVLEGYGDTNERIVTIYTVHKSGNISEGVPVTIKPLVPPIFLIRETLQAASTFGGVQVTWDNPFGKEICIALYAPDSITHEMELFDRYYSKNIKGKTSFRRFKNEEQNFRIEMFDRWQNYATDMEISLTPLKEILIPGKNEQGVPVWSLFDDDGLMPDGIRKYAYRCEISHHQEGLPGFENCIDWGTSTNWYPIIWYWNLYFPDLPEGVFSPPYYFTLDMGKEAVYSRFKYTVLPGSTGPFHYNAFALFNIWGCNDPKLVEEVECPHGIYPKGSRKANQAYWSSWKAVNGTDAWKEDGWVLLSQCQYLLSDGEIPKYVPNQKLSDEDDAKVQTEGIEFEFSENVTDAYRYLRFEILRFVRTDGVYGRQIVLTGFQFWGDFPK